MPAKKKAAAEKADEPQAPKAPEPSDVNDSLASDRMKALLEDHRRMGARPG